MSAVSSQIGPWALVPRWVRQALRGQSRALELYVLLAEIMDRGGDADCTIERTRKWLADELGCSRDTLDRAVGTLVDAGAVVVEHQYDTGGNYLPSRYVIYQVAPMSATQSETPEERDEGGGRTDAATGTDAEGVAAPVPTPLPHGCLEGGRAGAVAIPEPFNQNPLTRKERPDVASDDGRPSSEIDEPAIDHDEGTDRLGRSITPQQLLAASLAVAFDWDPKLVDPDQRKQIVAAVSKLAGKGVGWEQLDEIRDRVWVMRASPDEKRNPSPAQFANEWGRIRLEPVVVSRREQAVDVVRSAVAALGRDLSVTDRLAAEWAVAVLLGREKPVAAVKRAMQRAEGPWSINYLERAILDVEHDAAVGRRTAAQIPADTASLSDDQIIGFLQHGEGAERAALQRLSDEVSRRLDEPGVDRGRLRFYADRAGSRDGWPRGVTGDVHTIRFLILDWAKAKLVALDAQPALSKGA